MTALNWRKSTHSSSGTSGNCVETASGAAKILVRDTTDRDGGTLAFTAGAWRVFTAELRRH